MIHGGVKPPFLTLQEDKMSTDIVIEKKKTSIKKVQPPKKYCVVIMNDDVTPMEFVIILLMKIYKHDESTAKDVMLKIHNQGRAIVGTYNYEIAEQKAIDGVNFSRSNGWPLIIKVEEE